MKLARQWPACMLMAGWWLIAACQGTSKPVTLPPVQSEARAPETSGEPQLIWLDTDIGDDIDDAFALGLALKSPELQILGVSTTFGDTEARARLLDRYLSAAGRGDVAAAGRSAIPVGAGPATKTDNVFTQLAYARATGRKHPDGVEMMLNAIRAHPGQVTLIAIGPLFTVQAAIEKDAATFKKLKRVVLMGGSLERGYDGANGERRPPEPEWNIDRDPAGAQALFAAGVPIFMMPLDSTQIHLDETGREGIFKQGTPVTDQITLLYHEWVAGDIHRTTPTLFDPVTVAFAVHPELCPVRPMRVEVDARGMTRAVPGEPNAQVCLQSDEKGFLSLLMERVTQP